QRSVRPGIQSFFSDAGARAWSETHPCPATRCVARADIGIKNNACRITRQLSEACSGCDAREAEAERNDPGSDLRIEWGKARCLSSRAAIHNAPIAGSALHLRCRAGGRNTVERG